MRLNFRTHHLFYIFTFVVFKCFILKPKSTPAKCIFDQILNRLCWVDKNMPSCSYKWRDQRNFPLHHLTLKAVKSHSQSTNNVHAACRPVRATRSIQRGRRTLLQHLLTLRQQTPTSFTVSRVKLNKKDTWQADSTLVVSRALQTGFSKFPNSCKISWLSTNARGTPKCTCVPCATQQGRCGLWQ